MNHPPPEPPVDRSRQQLAPGFVTKLDAFLADMANRGHQTVIAETFRTPERQEWLYGFGREYDDGRGIVTRAESAGTSYHGYGLAADCVDALKAWDASDEYWAVFGDAAEAAGLTWGGRWTHPDKPHVQLGGMPHVAPSENAQTLYAAGNIAEVWRQLGCDA